MEGEGTLLAQKGNSTPGDLNVCYRGGNTVISNESNEPVRTLNTDPSSVKSHRGTRQLIVDLEPRGPHNERIQPRDMKRERREKKTPSTHTQYESQSHTHQSVLSEGR